MALVTLACYEFHGMRIFFGHYDFSSSGYCILGCDLYCWAEVNLLFLSSFHQEVIDIKRGNKTAKWETGRNISVAMELGYDSILYHLLTCSFTTRRMANSRDDTLFWE